ncbi:Holliday junction resolvase RecU [Carnobacterium pleistocenium]|uniref:Holliday junction resolvase RecU n=1 Tax=Carnobacterium pleistocenium TaxID=181073 RepID=UPI0005517308|nr:Holliday junction resolvase RecU [Carnobacterium pleistocenium]
MTIRYPNGKTYVHSDKSSPKKQLTNQLTSFSKRGMSLEEDLNASNQYYLAKGNAVIHKKPTPVQIVKVDYPKRSAAVIKEAYFRHASTTDYNGVYQGHYLDFEAKETKNKLSFPLKNFHEHQIIHMQQCIDQQAICFVIMRFTISERLFLLEAKYLLVYWNDQQKDGRKSIPLKELEKKGYEMYYELSPRIPYLEIVDRLISKNKDKST